MYTYHVHKGKQQGQNYGMHSFGNNYNDYCSYDPAIPKFIVCQCNLQHNYHLGSKIKTLSFVWAVEPSRVNPLLKLQPNS